MLSKLCTPLTIANNSELGREQERFLRSYDELSELLPLVLLPFLCVFSPLFLLLLLLSISEMFDKVLMFSLAQEESIKFSDEYNRLLWCCCCCCCCLLIATIWSELFCASFRCCCCFNRPSSSCKSRWLQCSSTISGTQSGPFATVVDEQKLIRLFIEIADLRSSSAIGLGV